MSPFLPMLALLHSLIYPPDVFRVEIRQNMFGPKFRYKMRDFGVVQTIVPTCDPTVLTCPECQDLLADHVTFNFHIHSFLPYVTSSASVNAAEDQNKRLHITGRRSRGKNVWVTCINHYERGRR